MSTSVRRRGDCGDAVAVAFAAYGLLFLVWVASGVGSAPVREILSDLAFLPVNLAAPSSRPATPWPWPPS